MGPHLQFVGRCLHHRHRDLPLHPLCRLALDGAIASHRANPGDEVAQGGNREAELELGRGVPFSYVVMTLVAGLNGATDKQPGSVKSLVVSARYLTVISWLTYPGVYIIKSMGLAGNVATTYEQVGYSVADVVAKAVFGVLIWAIASGKSAEEGLL